MSDKDKVTSKSARKIALLVSLAGAIFVLLYGILYLGIDPRHVNYISTMVYAFWTFVLVYAAVRVIIFLAYKISRKL